MQGQDTAQATWRRIENTGCMRRLRAARKRRGVPERRAIADMLLAVLLQRRPETLHIVTGPLIDLGYDEGETLWVVGKLVEFAEAERAARADVDTSTRQAS